MLPSVDYTAPQAPAAWGAGGLAVPPVPLPEARSHQQPSLPVCEDRLSLRELEIALGGVALTSEGELCELSLWCGGLQPIGTQLPQASPNTVAKQLCFAPSASGATTAASGPPAPLHEHGRRTLQHTQLRVVVHQVTSLVICMYCISHENSK